MNDSEDATDTLAETLAAMVYLAAQDGLDPTKATSGSWSISAKGGTLKAGTYSGTFSADDIAAVLAEEESEEPAGSDDESAGQ